MLSEFPPGAEAVALAHRLTPSALLARRARRASRPRRAVRRRVHVKVDTGMHRVGVWPPEDAAGVPAARSPRPASRSRASGRTSPRARTTRETTSMQLVRYGAALDAAKAAGFVPRLRHAANSGGLLRHPESHFDLVRPGIALYGVGPDAGRGRGSWVATRAHLALAVAFARPLAEGERLSYGLRYALDRDAVVATVPVGYADGYPRAASSRADVLIRGRRCRVAGSVTMDQLIVDCGDLRGRRRRRGRPPRPPGRRGDRRMGARGARGHDRLRDRHADRRACPAHVRRSVVVSRTLAEVAARGVDLHEVPAGGRPHPGRVRRGRPATRTCCSSARRRGCTRTSRASRSSAPRDSCSPGCSARSV